ncbi:hypothetical protein C8A03DRAFT_13101 [Achaetomium macrosporum]|uniref:Uncharacterized protein n=1 Tax=Achaetomium macrosporum TaxID=79813 RepID=A0AAN7CF11_9PEZI|nr:hypothetical protein C8A03DRAFT_13101 [Achaetomium macrosporum]
MAPDANADILGTLDRSTLLEFAALLRFDPPPAYTSSSPNNSAVLPQTWLDAQAYTIATTLSDELLARATAITNLSNSFTKLFRPNHHHFPILGGMKLCPAHKKLDFDLLTHCFTLLAAEVSVRCDVLRGYLCRLHPRSHNPATLAVIRDMVAALSGVASLYLSAEDFERYFGAASTKPEYRFLRVANGCPACVLAAVGGRREVLVALRGNILGRARGKQPRLLRLVEAWMEMFGGGLGVEAEMRRKSDALAGEVKAVRRLMHEKKVQRRARKGRSKSKRKGEGEGRSKHRGGMPAGVKIVGGVPMPQVRVDGDRRRQQQQLGSPPSYNYRAFGLDGAGGSDDLSGARRNEETGQWDIWSSSVSSSSSASSLTTDTELDANGEFIPARKHWPQTHRPSTATTQRDARRRESESIYSAAGAKADRPSSILRDAPCPSAYTDVRLDDDESVKIFLDPSQPSQPRNPRRQSQRSTSTNWADFYRE